MFVNTKFLWFFLLSSNIVYALPAPRNTDFNDNIVASNATNTENTNQTAIDRSSNTSATKLKAGGVFYRVMQILLDSLWKILSLPKINTVMKNIATCVVNGAMEIITFYFPAPLIPIIASAAGMMFPFAPVLELTEMLPVTSYRRAFLSAVNSFLGTFDRNKFVENYDYDPYMMQRFRRRLMNIGENDKPVLNEVDGAVINKIR